VKSPLRVRVPFSSHNDIIMEDIKNKLFHSALNELARLRAIPIDDTNRVWVNESIEFIVKHMNDIMTMFSGSVVDDICALLKYIKLSLEHENKITSKINLVRMQHFEAASKCRDEERAIEEEMKKIPILELYDKYIGSKEDNV
jgi:hypothetical protein